MEFSVVAAEAHISYITLTLRFSIYHDFETSKDVYMELAKA